MTLILPEELHDFFDAGKGEFFERNPLVDVWLKRAGTIFEWYLEDLQRGLKPQIARDILPNLLKSEILVSGRWSGWKHFIALRDTPQAHPRIRELAKEVRRYFYSIGIGVNDNDTVK
jgi:thymidylate synthase ThyX